MSLSFSKNNRKQGGNRLLTFGNRLFAEKNKRNKETGLINVFKKKDKEKFRRKELLKPLKPCFIKKSRSDEFQPSIQPPF